MPSISYLEDPNPYEGKRHAAGQDASPEPPMRYDSSSNNGGAPQDPQGPYRPDVSGVEFRSLRRLITLAQVLAIVSLLFGGVLLSAVSIVIAFIAYRKTDSFGLQTGDDALHQALRRSAKIAIIVGFIALALNAIALIVLYPVVMDMVQSGDYQSLFGSMQGQGAAPSTSGSGGSTWG